MTQLKSAGLVLLITAVVLFVAWIVITAFQANVKPPSWTLGV